MPRTFSIIRGRERCFETIYLMALSSSFLMEACRRVAGSGPPIDESALISESIAADYNFQIVTTGFVRVIIENRYQRQVDIQAFPKEQKPPDIGYQDIDVGSQYLNMAWCSFFSLYLDSVIEWGKQNISNNYAEWPPVLNFARGVRNAIVHGTVNQSIRAPHLEWQGVELTHNLSGKHIFYDNILTIGDLIALLLDLDLELDQIGAPKNLGTAWQRKVD